MSVRERLNRLTGEAKRRDREEVNEEILKLRRRIDAIMARRPLQAPAAFEERCSETGRTLEEVIDGIERCNGYGSCFISRAVTAGSSRHGYRRVGEVGALDMHRAALLAADGRIARYDLSKGLFLDTETTGLSGGAGTTAFLIGLGWWQEESFVTEQIFLRDFSEEGAALAILRDIAATRDFLVTFNGKAFDIGLLSARFIMNRQGDPFADLPHLDLLFPSRRLLGHRLENSRLVTLEEQVLGFRRRGDVPGYEIPGRYFDWLRRKDAAVLEDVFLHNRLDVISMAVLAVHLAELIDPAACENGNHDADLLAASRLLIDRGDEAAAVRMLETLAGARCGRVSSEAKKALSLLYKRMGEWRMAVAIWETMIGDDPGDLFALAEMAKWCEHRAGELEKAIALVEQALLHAGDAAEHREAFLYRKNRLLRKYGRRE